MTVSTLPPLRQPPHDPLTLLLGGRLGWPVVDDALSHADGSLRLPRFPGSLRVLTEPSGSLGGLRLPANAATDSDGVVWLLAPEGGLRRFDPCGCGFTDVPCPVVESRASRRPAGIAIAARHLFVPEPEGGVVRVLLLPQLVVSGVWRAPMEWTPSGVAVDSRFRVHVMDPQNGLVHHFGWSGRYLGNTAGVGASRFVAVAADRSLVVAGESAAYRVEGEDVTPLTSPADDLGDLLAPERTPVSPDGAMNLGVGCVPPRDQWFDTSGRPMDEPPSPPAQLYERAATTVIGPLDSLIDDCVWDRLVLVGELPNGCSVHVETYTGQVALTEAEVGGLPPNAWETQVTCTALESGSWDALVRSRPGRFLWIRLRLAGNGLTSPRLDEALVEFPRISLRRFMPSVYGVEPTTADFTDRLLAIVDRMLREREEVLDEVPALLDPQATERLDWLASWIGLRPDPRLPERVRRGVVADAGCLLDQRGTLEGLHRLLLVALGLDRRPDCPTVCGCTLCPPPRQTCPPQAPEPSWWQAPRLVLEHFRLRRWFEAGAGTLGDQTMLWGQSIVRRSQLGHNAQVGVTALKGTPDPLRDPFHVHAHKFTVFVPASAGRTPGGRKAIQQLVAWGSPAHTVGHVEYVDARMRIGVQSSIGLDSVVARLPSGFALGHTTLGPASVLSSDDRHSVDTSAVGTTAVLG